MLGQYDWKAPFGSFLLEAMEAKHIDRKTLCELTSLSEDEFLRLCRNEYPLDSLLSYRFRVIFDTPVNYWESVWYGIGQLKRMQSAGLKPKVVNVDKDYVPDRLLRFTM